MIRNFTARARRTLLLAGQEAGRLNHHFVGTEHILLGLIKLGQGPAINVLKKRGINPEEIRVKVEKCAGAGAGEKLTGRIPYTPRVKKALALAAKEARNLNHKYVGTEHLLLGLLREGAGVAARVLAQFGIDIETIRVEILKELNPNDDA